MIKHLACAHNSLTSLDAQLHVQARIDEPNSGNSDHDLHDPTSAVIRHFLVWEPQLRLW
jgi:hypothetical protein